jgi:hypothetical protein
MDKLTEKQYRFICELIWGSSPIDKEWAMLTPIFKEKAPKILERYPKLDVSFHEECKQYNEFFGYMFIVLKGLGYFGDPENKLPVKQYLEKYKVDTNGIATKFNINPDYLNDNLKIPI